MQPTSVSHCQQDMKGLLSFALYTPAPSRFSCPLLFPVCLGLFRASCSLQSCALVLSTFASLYTSIPFLTSYACLSHSQLRGVVARAALDTSALRAYRHYLHAFITLASPHLGLPYSSSIYGAGNNPPFSASFCVLMSNFASPLGVFLVRKWRKSKALEQLQLGDAKDWRETYLFSLASNSLPSTNPGEESPSVLSLFNHIVLVASKQV